MLKHHVQVRLVSSAKEVEMLIVLGLPFEARSLLAFTCGKHTQLVSLKLAPAPVGIANHNRERDVSGLDWNTRQNAIGAECKPHGLWHPGCVSDRVRRASTLYQMT